MHLFHQSLTKILLILPILQTVSTLHHDASNVPAKHGRIVLLPLNETHNLTRLYHYHHSSTLVQNINTTLHVLRFPAMNHTLEMKMRMGQEENIPSQNQPTHFLSLASFVFISVGLLRRIAKKRYRRRLRMEVEKDLEWAVATSDILYSATPSDIDYGSFSSPWSGDLDKFDV